MGTFPQLCKSVPLTPDCTNSCAKASGLYNHQFMLPHMFIYDMYGYV